MPPSDEKYKIIRIYCKGCNKEILPEDGAYCDLRGGMSFHINPKCLKKLEKILEKEHKRIAEQNPETYIYDPYGE